MRSIVLEWAVQALAKAGTLSLGELGVIDPLDVLAQMEPLCDAIEAYKAFDRRQPGWIKVELRPQAGRKAA